MSLIIAGKYKAKLSLWIIIKCLK